MKNILVAIDLDPNTQQLVDYAVQLAKAFEAKLWLIHIAEAEPDFIGYSEGPQYIRDTFAKELRDEHKAVQSLCNQVKKEGLDAEGLMIQGPTIDMILQEAEKLKADLIITATHHRNFIYKAFIGSVSTELFERSTIPLLAYPVGQ